MVGQRFIQLLEAHPWFETTALCASSRSSGKPYSQACTWKLDTDIPTRIRSMTVLECTVEQVELSQSIDPSKAIVFSALDSSVAGSIEESFASAGYRVFSNAKNHRFSPHVPLIVPLVNPDHLDMIHHQNWSDKGFIVTNANCSSTGLVIPLHALHRSFGIEKVFICTMQALSGAGYPGVSSIDVIDNVIPFISGEEPKLETEPLKILGMLDADKGEIEPADIVISAQCNRVAVLDGHTECVSVSFKSKPSLEEVYNVLDNFTPCIDELGLPSCPNKPIMMKDQDDRPQPRFDRMAGKGYSVSVGRLRECPILDFKFVVLSHNTILGAAGSSILNAELAYAKGVL